MSIASSIPCELQQPTGIHRVAQHLGRALVEWSERPSAQVDSRPYDGVQQLAAERILSDRALSVSSRRTPLF